LNETRGQGIESWPSERVLTAKCNLVIRLQTYHRPAQATRRAGDRLCPALGPQTLRGPVKDRPRAGVPGGPRGRQPAHEHRALYRRVGRHRLRPNRGSPALIPATGRSSARCASWHANIRPRRMCTSPRGIVRGSMPPSGRASHAPGKPPSLASQCTPIRSAMPWGASSLMTATIPDQSLELPAAMHAYQAQP
jgi:hypothetical protein